MSRNALFYLSFIVWSGAFAQLAFGRVGQEFSTSDIMAIDEFVSGEIADNQRGKVLVVLDIDNTMIRPTTNLGSEQWFVWQLDVLKATPNSPLLVGKSMDEILKRQDWILMIGGTVPVDIRMPNVIAEFGVRGARLMSLTSRTPATRDMTLQQFQSNRISIPEFAPSVRSGTGAYLPYDLNVPEKSGLNTRDLALVKNQAARPVIYDRGVLLTDGQHKGVMLKAFISKLRSKPEVVIFIDDREHHHEGMRAAFADESEILVHSIRYTVMTPAIQAFETSNKQTEVRQWEQLRGGICKSFGGLLSELCMD